MTIHHRPIPILPCRPKINPIAGNVRRSYPVGRQSFSRACIGDIMELTIKSESSFSGKILANLITSMNSVNETEYEKYPFIPTDDRTLTCHIKPMHPGLFSFRAEFSLDSGASWFRDTVADAWVLVDPPQVDGLCIYTVIPNISGKLSDWKANLKHIREMGFNAVHLLPLTTLDTSESPYSARDLFNIDSSYLNEGSKKNGLAQLEDYIEEARSLNISLCFDLVLNHVGINSFMAQQAPDWIVPDLNRPDGLQRARYWDGQGWHYWEDLVLINYEHPSDAIRSEIWAYMIDYALFWAKYANDTRGFVRFDNLHSSNPDFVQALTIRLHKDFPNVGILAEYFADETTLLHTGPKWGLNLNLATPWDYKFVPKLREYLNYIHRVSMHIRYFMPLTSHDSGTPAQEFGGVESTVPRYVAAALLGTGATGIIQGVEYGALQKIAFIGRKPKMVFPPVPVFADFIRRVNSILAHFQAFRRGENCLFVDNGHHAVIAAFRQDIEQNCYGFLVVCNFDIFGQQQISFDLSSFLPNVGPYSYCELISDQIHEFPNSSFELLLQPCSAQVIRFLKNN